MAVTASFAPTTGVLTEFGDTLDNTITTTRDAAGQILVNGGAVQVVGGTPTVANTVLIQAFGQGGNDTLTLNEASGALPAALLFGGAGNDVITGGSGRDQLFGQSDNDTLLGKGGNDFLFGGDGNDTLTGGDGDDQTFGEGGDDRFIWNPGDDTDLFEGGDGTDTAEVNGGNGAEVFTVTANGARVRFDRLDPAPFSLDLGTTENLVINANGGNDSFSATGDLASLIAITFDGGAGNDTILGSNGADLLRGGADNDFVDGNQGNDTIFLGAGDDVAQWHPGGGSDIVEGGDGIDRLDFRGSAATETMDISANGGRVRLTRDVGNIVMDLDDVEQIDISALGGTDTVTVRDVTGTDLTKMNIDLAGTLGGASADGQADQVIVQGSNGDDVVSLSSANGAMSVLGLAASVNITHADGGLDVLRLQTFDGGDVIDAGAVAAGQMLLQIEGGLGDDTVIGSAGNDLVIGGDGNDTALLGAGDDTFVWNPGDDNDTIEGQAGFDVLKFNGANVGENIAIIGQNGRALLFRDVANVVMDTDGVERIDFNAFGGADNITVGNLAGTDVGRVSIDLAATLGSSVGDGAFDQVVVNATRGDDHVTVTASGSLAIVGGLRAQVTIDHAEATDRLVAQGLDGNDFIEATTFPAGGMALTLDGGAGNDVLSGGGGSDLLLGGDGVDLVVGRQGNDLAFLGNGNDSFIWNPDDGSDFIDGEAGFDALTFRASNAGENVTIGANGGQAELSSNLGNVTLNVDNVERIEVNGLGGADNVTVKDLTGTDVVRVAIDLAANIGGSTSDGQVDHVTVNGGAAGEIVNITNSGGLVIVTGTPAQTTVDHTDAADELLVSGGGGNDTLNASALTPGLMKLTLDGGAGDDTLTGTLGHDTFVFAFGSGADTITNFTHAAGDVIDLQGTGISNFAQLQALMTDHGIFTTIDFGAGGSLNLLGLHPEQLQANDFLLS